MIQLEHSFHFVGSVESITHEVSTSFGLSVTKGSVGAAGALGFAKGIENKLKTQVTVQYAVIKEKNFAVSLDVPDVRLAKNVIDDVLRLASKEAYKEADYSDFFLTHGTHVVTEVDVGGMYYVSAETNVCKMETSTQDISKFETGLEEVTKGLTASPSLGVQQLRVDFVEEYKKWTKTKKQVLGGDRAEINGDTIGYDCWKKSIKSHPETIGLTLEPIWGVIFKSTNEQLSSGLETNSSAGRATIRARFDVAYKAFVKEDVNREDTKFDPPCKLGGGMNVSPGFASTLFVAMSVMAVTIFC